MVRAKSELLKIGFASHRVLNVLLFVNVHRHRFVKIRFKNVIVKICITFIKIINRIFVNVYYLNILPTLKKNCIR